MPAAANTAIARHRIAVLAFDRISPFHLAVPCAVFGHEQGPGPHTAAEPQFDLRVCAAEPGLLRTTAGFAVQPAYGLEAVMTVWAVFKASRP